MDTASGAPILASTVLLLRDALLGPEVFLLRRPASSSFAPRAFVFPGGAVDSDDGLLPLADFAPSFDVAAAAAGMNLGGDDGERACAAYHIAGVREVFEESGVLIGSHSDGSPLGTADTERLRTARHDMLNGASLTSVLRRDSLQLAPERLVYSARFVTPASESKRFDARFFAVLVDLEQEASHHSGEATEGGWFPTANVVDSTSEFRFMMPPTRIMCRRIAGSPSAAAALQTLGDDPIDASDFTVEQAVRWAFADLALSAEEST